MKIDKSDFMNWHGVLNGVFVRDGKQNITYKFYSIGIDKPRLILN